MFCGLLAVRQRSTTGMSLTVADIPLWSTVHWGVFYLLAKVVSVCSWRVFYFGLTNYCAVATLGTNDATSGG